MAPEKVKIYCRTCTGPRNHSVCYEQDGKITPAESSDADASSSKKYQTVECFGCETVSFRELISTGDSTVENLYPPQMLRPARNYGTAAPRVPPNIAAIYKATMSAFNNGAENESSFILCAGGMRCMLELICDNLDVKGVKLEDKIAGLGKAGHLTEARTKLLQDARFLGNDALHEGRIPVKSDLDGLLDLFEDTIKELYIQLERFEKGKMLAGIVTEIRGDGILVRVGKSTSSFIPHSEIGIESGDNNANVVQLQQRISVKVMSGRDEELLLSKKAADATISEEAEERRTEAEKRRIEEETRKARREALMRIRNRDLLEGTVTQVRNNGVFVSVTKGDTVVEGWIPAEEAGVPRNQSLSQALKNGKRIHVVVLVVDPNNDELILSKRAGDWEKAYRDAEDAFIDCTILHGKVNGVAPDGHKLLVWVGCNGVAHESQVGEGDQSDLNEWVGQVIPVRVIGSPDRLRKAPIHLSHRAALKRKEALDALKVGQQFTGKVNSVYPWGAVVSVNGTDGVLQKADMASQKISKDDEIQLEVIQLDARKGSLGLKIVSDETGVGEDMDIDTEQDMNTEDDMNIETSEYFQESVNTRDENIDAQESTGIEDQGVSAQTEE